MIQLDQVEVLFGTLIETVKKQQSEIDDLKDLCKGLMRTRDANERFKDFSNSLDRIEGKVEVINLAATAHIGDKRYHELSEKLT
jgi:hypothetical protein